MNLAAHFFKPVIKNKYLFWSLIGGIILRLVLIFMRQYPHNDEIWALYLAESSFKDIWLGTFSDFHAPLYFFFLKVLNLIFVFSPSVFTLRFISLFFNVLSIFSMWHLGHYFGGEKLANTSFLLSLFLPGFIFHSVFGRYYAFLVLLTILYIWCFLKYIETKKITFLVSLGIIACVGIYTHYYFIFLPSSLLLFILFAKNFRAILFKISLVHLLVAITFIPGFYYLTTLAKPQLDGRHINHIVKIPAIVPAMFLSGEAVVLSFFDLNLTLFLILIGICSMTFLTLLCLGCWKWKHSPKHLLLTFLFLPILGSVLFAYTIQPLLALGSLTIFIPVWILFTAHGLNMYKTRFLTLMFSLCVAIGVGLSLHSSRGYLTIKKDFIFFESNRKTQDLILHSHLGSYFFASYLTKKQHNYKIADAYSATAETERAVGFESISMTNALNYPARIWYFESPFLNSQTSESIRTTLAAHRKLIYSEVFPSRSRPFDADFYNVFLFDKLE